MRPLLDFSACVFLTLIVCTVGRAQKPELFVQTGPSGDVGSVAFTPDGKTLASADRLGVRIWDVSTGSELRTFDARGIVVFGPDGKTLITSKRISDCRDCDAVKWWDVATGRVLQAVKGYGWIVLSPDLKTLVSGEDAKLTISSVATGATMHTLPARDRTLRPIWSIAFSPDGGTLAIGDAYTIELWNVTTGSRVHMIKGAGLGRVAFSRDGEVLASTAFADRNETSIKLWDVATGKELRTITWPSSGVDEQITSFAFSPDGKTFASLGSNIKIWDLEKGTELRTFNWPSRSINLIAGTEPMRTESVAFSPDGRMLAGGNHNSSITLWDVATGAELRTLEALSTPLKPSESFGARSWNIDCDATTTFKLAESMTGAQSELQRLSAFRDSYFSKYNVRPDRRIVARMCGSDTIKFHDVETGAEVRTLIMDPALHNRADDDEKDQIHSFAFSPNGKILATSNDSTVRLWSSTTGARIRTFRARGGSGGDAIAFSPDGKILAIGGDGSIKLVSVATGAELRVLNLPSETVWSIAFSPDGKTLAGGNGKSIRLWNFVTGAVLHTLSEGGLVTFSPDGAILAAGGLNAVTLWSVATGRQLHTLERAGQVMFSRDSKYIISDVRDMTLYEVRTGQVLASLRALNWHDWLVVTPDGLFDGTPAAWSKIIWRFNNDTFNYTPVESYFNDFYHPGLLNDILAGKNPKAPSDISQKDRRQPHLKLRQIYSQPGTTLTTRSARVEIEIANAPAGAQDVRLFRNGSLVHLWPGDALNGERSAKLEATVSIIAGENRLTAYAFNRDNIKSVDVTLTIIGSDDLKRRGTAYLLAVGVNTYSNTNYNLKYAVPDAQDFAAEIKRQQDALKKYERVEVIPLYDKDATKANILQKLSELATKVQPEDAVIVYFSGHGTAAQQRFYLIPHDLAYQGPRTKLSEADLKSILDHSISDRELEEAFEKIDAGQMLMVIDACNSGQALDSEEKRRGPMNSKGLAQLAYEKGMYILTAAQSYQAAWEASRLGHGFLTYALVEEGLKKGIADKEPKDNQIVLREWLDYATERVPQMQEEKLKETPQKKDQQGRELEFVFVEGDETIKDPTKRTIQRPRVFYRRELESQPLIVARPQAAAPPGN